jgi:hypothetical protein
MISYGIFTSEVGVDDVKFSDDLVTQISGFRWKTLFESGVVFFSCARAEKSFGMAADASLRIRSFVNDSFVEVALEMGRHDRRC